MTEIYDNTELLCSGSNPINSRTRFSLASGLANFFTRLLTAARDRLYLATLVGIGMLGVIPAKSLSALANTEPFQA